VEGAKNSRSIPAHATTGCFSAMIGKSAGRSEDGETSHGIAAGVQDRGCTQIHLKYFRAPKSTYMPINGVPARPNFPASARTRRRPESRERKNVQRLRL
jgi:hypothetical protein